MKAKHQHHDVSCQFCTARLTSVFNVLEGEQVLEMSSQKSCATYKKGQYLFTENSTPLGVFCINSGKIKLTTTGFDGKEQILRLSKSGDIVGYRALVSGERYNSSAVALEDCSVCFIPKDYFIGLMKTDHKLCFEVAKKISGDLRTAEDHIVSLSQKNIRERMAEALLFLKATYGYAEDGQTLNVIMSREEIADYVGTSTESAIRLLSEFNHDKLVELNGKRIKIINLEKLIKTANIGD